FSERLRERLATDERVLGLVALGSMSGEPPPDQWSDHDFFVISRPGEQERMRTELSWLPDGEEIVLAYRETAHGVKVLYRDAHLLEFAVFDPEEMSVARINRFRVLLDRGGVAERTRALRLLPIALGELPQRIAEFPLEAARAVEASIEADSR